MHDDRAVRGGAIRAAACAAAAAAVAGTIVLAAGPTGAAEPGDPAGLPFLTMAQTLAAGDYARACAQLSAAALREGAPGLSSSAARRSACVADFESHADTIKRKRYDSTRIVKVRVKPGRARVTVQTTFHDIEPRATGTAVIEDGVWKVREQAGGAHVGSLLLYTIPHESMRPTMTIGDTVLIDEDAYLHARPRVGDVVVFRPPAGAERGTQCAKRPPRGQACAIATPRDARVNFIKRIVAGPGDSISIRDGRVIRNSKRAAEPFITPCERGASLCDYPRTFTVAPGRWYVLGDNRGASDDSRFWGPVARSALVGRMQRVIACECPTSP